MLDTPCNHHTMDRHTPSMKFTVRENMTTFDAMAFQTTSNTTSNKNRYVLRKLLNRLPSCSELKQYLAVLLCGLSAWGCAWFLCGPSTEPGSPIFHMCVVVILGYVAGHTLERFTAIHPVVGMTLIGALYRNFVPGNFLDDPTAKTIDFHLRRVYPVVILTRGPLSWDWEYIRRRPTRVFSLATLPWMVECMAVAALSHVLLDFTWYWGLHLGAILSSVSPAVVVPTLTALSTRSDAAEGPRSRDTPTGSPGMETVSSRSLISRREVALLVGNAGGLDTAFTEGMFGIINTAIFCNVALPVRIAKALSAIFVGILFGVVWGVVIDYVPDHQDLYAPTARSLLIFLGGLLLSYAGAYFCWGGVSGVAIMVCAATAATRWSRRGWSINDNPVAEVYKLLWRVLEPMLFALSGYYLEVKSISTEDLLSIVGVIMAALILRLVSALLVCVANDMTLRESLLVTAAWIPKAIVEAVLVRVATDSVETWTDEGTASLHDNYIARQHSNIIVIAILITSTLGSALTTILGPILLSKDTKVAPQENYFTQTPSNSASRFNHNIHQRY